MAELHGVIAATEGCSPQVAAQPPLLPELGVGLSKLRLMTNAVGLAVAAVAVDAAEWAEVVAVYRHVVALKVSD